MDLNKKNVLTNSNFGKWGWSMVVYSFIMYYFWAGLTADGMNIYTTAFPEAYGLDSNTILGYGTPAGMIGVIGGIIAGRLLTRIGVRNMSAGTLIITGAVFVLFGNFATTHGSYFALLTLFNFFATAFGLISNAALMSNWFPRKKGIALGWSTMGAPACTATFVAILAMLVATQGVGMACTIIGVVIVVVGVISFFWVKDYPEQVGAFPDNIKEGLSELSQHLEQIRSYKSPFSIKVLLKDKDMWLISLGFGCLWLVTGGIVSQFIPRMLSVGYDIGTALVMLTIASVVGIGGSYFWGWLDQRVGTKLASLIYTSAYVIALILLIIGTPAATNISIIFVGIGLGGILNLMPSLVVSVYGRYDFPAANALVSPIASFVRNFCFMIMAALLMRSGGDFTMPYLVFIGIDIVGLILLLFVTKQQKGKAGL
ncbi:MAG: MFS transporter [Clostridiales bacterium]|nr:MFS transporter [Clostridiales bacterium]